MSPSQEFYQSRLSLMRQVGFAKEQVHNDLRPWFDAQLPSRPYLFAAKALIAKKELWGYVNAFGTTLGDGALMLPLSFDKRQKIEYSGLNWMVKANKEVLGENHMGFEMLRKVGLQFFRNYGECKVSTSGSSFSGILIALDIRRTILPSNGDHWRQHRVDRNMIGNVREATFALSAAGLATVLERDVPNMTITPQSFQILHNPVRPR